jgi:membrane protease YdiL (CAAX protease family)
MFYLLLFIFYSTIPPVALHFCLKLIYQEKNKYGWHLHYLTKFLITISFLPVLFLPKVNLALIPKSPLSILFFVLAVVLAILGIKPAIKKKVLYFYIGGVFASIMEEILFRGVLFGLAQAIWNNTLVSVLATSFAFGLWHLKNYAWVKDRNWIIKSFLSTGIIYGPLFAILRVVRGDIYLAVLVHFLVDAYVALAPKKLRWTIIGDKGESYKDDYHS